MAAAASRLLSLVRDLGNAASLGLLLPSSLAAQGFRLNAPLVPEGDVAEFQVAPDGRHVVYRADQAVDGVSELFSVSIDGGAPARLNAPLVAGGNVGLDLFHNFRISPDGSRVVYWADQDEDELFELFSVPIDGSLAPVQLNGSLVAGGDVLFTPDYLPAEAFAPITPDGSRVLYVADQEQDEVFELYSAPIDGSGPAVKLNGSLAPGGNVIAVSPPFGPNPIWPQVSADGSSAVYRADQEVAGVIEIYSVPLDGSGAPVKLNSPLGPAGDVFSARLSRDAAWVLFVASTDAFGPTELFRVPLRGSPARARRTDDRNRLNVPLGPSERVSLVSISPDSTRVVYQANPGGGATDELFSVPIGGGRSALLSVLGDGEVFSNAIAADGERVVYLAGTDCAFDSKLFSVPLDGSEDRVRISSPSPLGYALDAYELTPDASRAVYAFALNGCCSSELHSVPIDGSAGPVQLNPSGTSGRAFRLTPDGRHVVYLQSPIAGGALELFAVPVDASRPAWNLSAPLVPGGNVGHDLSRLGFAATSGGRILYLADQDVDEVFELYVTFLERPLRRVR